MKVLNLWIMNLCPRVTLSMDLKKLGKVSQLNKNKKANRMSKRIFKLNRTMLNKMMQTEQMRSIKKSQIIKWHKTKTRTRSQKKTKSSMIRQVMN